jgi:hypothetical protein
MRRRSDEGTGVVEAKDTLESKKGHAAAEIAAERRASTKPGFDHTVPASGVTLTLAWGEEKYTLVANSFSTVTVGPFTASIDVPAGSSVVDAFERINRELYELAEIERERKLTSFVNKLRQAVASTRGQ